MAKKPEGYWKTYQRAPRPPGYWGSYEQLNREYRKKYRHEKRLIDLGTTVEEFDEIPRVCSICGTTESLVIDHCHATNKFRGILCGPCNSAIGFLRDSPELCEQAAIYLRRLVCGQ